MKTRIAYLGINGLPSKSGTERVIEAIVKRLADKYDLTAYCDSDYTPAETQYEGVKLIRIRTFKGRHIKPIILDIFSALHAVFFGNYDIIHMNGVENCFVIPLLRLRYKVISTSHGTPGRMPINKWSPTEHFLMRMAEYPFLYFSNYATAISAMDVEYLHGQYRKKVIYIPNGVDIDIPINRDIALLELSRLGITPHDFLLFAAGRIIQRKGAHILLEAFNKLNLDLPLVIIGDLAQVPDYEKRLKNLADGRRVFFIPAIEDRSTLFGLLDLCKLFVFPSTAEGMSVMLLEAASLGIPMVCSDIPENTSVLGESVPYFQSGDPADLADKIRWALDNPQEVTGFVQSTKDWVRKNYSWDLIASRYDTLYQQCVKGIPVSDVVIDPSVSRVTPTGHTTSRE